MKDKYGRFGQDACRSIEFAQAYIRIQNRHTDGHADTCSDGRTDIRHRHIERYTDTHTDRHTGRHADIELAFTSTSTIVLQQCGTIAL